MKSIFKALFHHFYSLHFTAAFDNEDVAAGGFTWKDLKWTVSL